MQISSIFQKYYLLIFNSCIYQVFNINKVLFSNLGRSWQKKEVKMFAINTYIYITYLYINQYIDH